LSISSSMKTGLMGAGLPQALEDAPGQRAHVGAPVPADLRLVAHAAERDAHELAPHRARDRAPERGLAHARRADEAQDRPARVGRSLRTPRCSRMRSLMRVEVRVVGVEDRARLREVERSGDDVDQGSSTIQSR
jgi:hypothetical protein